MKKVYIYAFLQKNLGDDLFIKVLCERYPKVKFYAMCDLHMMNSLNQIKNLKLIPRLRVFDKISNYFNMKINLNNRIQKMLSRYCDAIVNIGGSLFIENEKWEQKHLNFQYRIVKNKPIFLIGSNFGPYSNKEYLQKYTKTFSEFTDVCFREEHSYKLFHNYLENVRYNSDVVFSYEKIKEKPKTDNKYIVISVINLNSRKTLKPYEKLYIEFLKECHSFFNKFGYKVYFMSFCSIEGDELFINKLKDSFNFEIDTYIYDSDMEDALSFLNKSSGIVTSRFHGMILGWVFSIPVLPVIYSNKSLNVINDIGFKSEYLEIDKMDKYDFKDILNNFFNQQNIDLSKNKDSALKQFQELDKFLM